MFIMCQSINFDSTEYWTIFKGMLSFFVFPFGFGFILGKNQ